MRIRSIVGAVALAAAVLVGPYAVANAGADVGLRPMAVGGEEVASAPWAAGL